MKKIKNIENMNLNELLELEKQIQIIDKNEFKKIKMQYKLLPFTSFYTLNSIAVFNLLTTNPNILYLIVSGMAITTESILLSTLIPAIKIVKNNHVNLKSIKQKSYDDYRNNLPIKKELVRLYNNLLEDLISEINESKLDKDPLSISILIGSFLIPYGFLSYTQKFHIIVEPNLYSRDDNYYQNVELESLYVIAGYGNCRHVNNFIADILTKMEIKNDRIICFKSSKEIEKTEIENKILEDNFKENHIVIGFIYNDKYYIIDPIYNEYSIKKSENSYSYPYNDIDDYTYNIIPVLTPNIFQKELNWTPYLSNSFFTYTEVETRIQKIHKLLNEGEINRFVKFKLKNALTLQKIAYLTQIELERNNEKEKQKKISR